MNTELLSFLTVSIMDEIDPLTADEKIEFGYELISLGIQNLSYPLSPLLTDNCAMLDLHNMNSDELMNAGLAIIYLGIKEND
jgi:hypothetical protein